MDERIVVGQFEKWLCGWSPISLYIRLYLRHQPAKDLKDHLVHLGPGPHDRWLDVGCALGVYLKETYRLGHGRKLLAGVDISEKMIEEARERITGALGDDAPLRLEVASATALPFEDATFDAVVSNGVIKYLDDEQFSSFLNESRRVLKRGGRISIAEFGKAFNRLAAKMAPRGGIPTDNLRECAVLEEALDTHGFREVESFELGHFPWIPFTFEGAAGIRR